MANEIEIKLAVDNAAAARRMLRGAGFRVSKARVFEANTMFDTPRLSLRHTRTMLRLREAGRTFTLTYKGPPLPSRHKSREEVETEVSDARSMRTVLERLGFRPVWRYEKFRTEYRLDHSSGMATLDETPIGLYVELEGGPRWIDRAARELGFSPADYITASYSRLYLDYVKGRGVKAGDMVFAGRKPKSRR